MQINTFSKEGRVIGEMWHIGASNRSNHHRKRGAKSGKERKKGEESEAARAHRLMTIISRGVLIIVAGRIECSIAAICHRLLPMIGSIGATRLIDSLPARCPCK